MTLYFNNHRKEKKKDIKNYLHETFKVLTLLPLYIKKTTNRSHGLIDYPGPRVYRSRCFFNCF